MTNRTPLEQRRAMDATQAAGLPIDHLALLLDEVGELKADSKRLADRLTDALHARFGEAAAAARRIEGKDSRLECLHLSGDGHARSLLIRPGSRINRLGNSLLP